VQPTRISSGSAVIAIIGSLVAAATPSTPAATINKAGRPRMEARPSARPARNADSRQSST
jgi:hypothetical protein